MTSTKSEIKLTVDISNLGVIIPTFNAEKTIGGLIKELIDCGFKEENIIVVNDGSHDRTDEVVTHLGLNTVKHHKNLGKGAALKNGFAAARAKNIKEVLTLDADGQHMVSEIKKFLKWKDHYDLLIGLRNDRIAMPVLRRTVNRITSLIASLLSKKKIPDVQCGFRYVDLKIFNTITLKTNNYQTETEMVIKAIRHKYRTGFVPITTLYNSEKSHIKPVIDTIRFVIMAVSLLWR